MQGCLASDRQPRSIFVYAPQLCRAKSPIRGGMTSGTNRGEAAAVDGQVVPFFAVLRLDTIQAGRELKRKATTPTQTVGTAEER